MRTGGDHPERQFAGCPDRKAEVNPKGVAQAALFAFAMAVARHACLEMDGVPPAVPLKKRAATAG
jgi:hypothetical protein